MFIPFTLITCAIRAVDDSTVAPLGGDETLEAGIIAVSGEELESEDEWLLLDVLELRYLSVADGTLVALCGELLLLVA